MLRITRQTDYGIVLMTLFAGEHEKSVKSARDMAEETNLPLPTVSKILKCLTRGGLLESTRGVKGGYSLSRGSAQISVANIIVWRLAGACGGLRPKSPLMAMCGRLPFGK